MRFCVMCSSQFEPRSAYEDTCTRSCESALESEAQEMMQKLFAASIPEAVAVLGFEDEGAARAWLRDLRRTDTAPDGEVYFLSCGLDSEAYMKIGFSIDVMKRLRELQQASPIELRLVGRIQGTKDLERAIHDRFSHLRSRGEWFHLTDELWDFVKATTRNKSQ